MADPLTVLEASYDLIWDGIDAAAAVLLPTNLREKYERDTAGLELARNFRVPAGNSTRKKMSEPSISTRFGNFRSSDVASLRKTLEDNGEDRKSQAVINWRGQEVVVAFGWYLVEFVEGELAQRNHGGL